jgi:hypothetical protein
MAIPAQRGVCSSSHRLVRLACGRGKGGHRHNTGFRSSVRLSRLRATGTFEGEIAKRLKRLINGV